MSIAIPVTPDLVRQAVIEVARLPDSDLARVIDFIQHLRDERKSSARRALVAEIQSHADRYATDLRNLPREEVAAQFLATLEEIRVDAIAKGTALDEDWHGD